MIMRASGSAFDTLAWVAAMSPLRLTSDRRRARACSPRPRSPSLRRLTGAPPACAPDNGGLTLPKGFCAIVVDGNAGPVRQLAVAPDGDLYAAVSGRGLGGGVRAYRDRDGDGKPDERASFGPRGGNDVAVHGGYLYLALKDRIVRWRLTPGKLEPEGK